MLNATAGAAPREPFVEIFRRHTQAAVDRVCRCDRPLMSPWRAVAEVAALAGVAARPDVVRSLTAAQCEDVCRVFEALAERQRDWRCIERRLAHASRRRSRRFRHLRLELELAERGAA